MSYEIFYDKCFIKAEKDGKDVYFPMVYAGSSNCFEVGRNGRNGRRERSWWNFKYYLNEKQYGTLEEMLANLAAYREKVIQRNKENNEGYIAEGKADWCDEYSDERWGYFTGSSFGGGCKVTYGQFKGIFVTGVRKAITIEELHQFGVNVHIKSFIYSDEDAKKYKEAGNKDIYFTPETSKELIEKLDELEETLKETPYVSLYITMDASEYDMKRIRREKFPTKKTKPEYKDVDEYFVICVTGIGYLFKGTRNGFQYSPYQTGGKPFVSAKAAEKAMKRFKERHGSRYTLEVENVKQKTRLKV
jgi:hypothetical protein